MGAGGFFTIAALPLKSLSFAANLWKISTEIQ